MIRKKVLLFILLISSNLFAEQYGLAIDEIKLYSSNKLYYSNSTLPKNKLFKILEKDSEAYFIEYSSNGKYKKNYIMNDKIIIKENFNEIIKIHFNNNDEELQDFWPFFANKQWTSYTDDPYLSDIKINKYDLSLEVIDDIKLYFKEFIKKNDNEYIFLIGYKDEEIMGATNTIRIFKDYILIKEGKAKFDKYIVKEK